MGLVGIPSACVASDCSWDEAELSSSHQDWYDGLEVAGQKRIERLVWTVGMLEMVGIGIGKLPSRPASGVEEGLAQSYQRHFSHVERPSRILSSLCRMKKSS